MANSDIQLLFGVLGGGSLSGESGALIQSELSQIMDSLNKNPLKIKVALDAESTKKTAWTAQLQKKLDALNAGNKLSVTVSNIKLGTNAISSFKQQLGAVINTLNLDKDVSVSFTSKDIGEITTQFKSAGDAAAEAARKAAEFKVQMETLGNLKTSVQKSLSALTTGNESEEETAHIAGLTAQYEQWAVKIEEVRASKQATSGEYKATLEAEGVAIQNNISKMQQERQAAADAAAAQTAEAKSRQAAEDAARRAAEEARIAEEKAYGTTTERNTIYKQIADSITRIKKAQQDWSAAEIGKTSGEYANLSNYIDQLQNLQNRFSSLSKTELREELSAINSAFAKSSGVIKEAGENTKTLTARVGGLASKFTSWLTISQVVMKLYQAMKQMVTAVIEVDTAMTELRKVTDETEATYSKFLETAITRSKQLGATVADTVTASADFARLGYTLDEAAQLADAAIIYKNVGDGIEDITTASESIISTMKAFGIEAENSMLIVDKFNEVGNNFAISSKGVGDALIRSASALASGNNTLDESIALITAANSVVQDADVVGTTLKTVSMYLRAAKTEAEAADESTDGMANSVSELREELLTLTGGKVDIQIDEDTFKSTYQIIKELSEVWGELTDITQANILEQIGGKRNANVVSSLITNFQVAEDVMESTADAAGSAMAENEKYLNSIEGKISEFKATFQELAITFIDSDFVKGVVDFGTGLLNVLNAIAKVIDSIGGLNTVLGVTLGIMVAMNTKSIASFLTGLLKPIRSLIGFFSTAKSYGIGFGQAISNAFAQATAGVTTFQTALGVVGIAIAALSIGYTVFKKLHKSTEELVESSNELKSAFQDIRSETQSNIETLNGLSDEFNKLSAGVDRYGNNISLSTEDYARYKEIVEQIVGISPALIQGYDAENGYLVEKNNLLERAIELQEQEYRTELRGMTTTEKLSEALAGSVATYSDILNGSALKSDSDLNNSIWRLFNIDNRTDIPKEMESGEFLARQIMSALGVENIDSELQKYFNEYGYWQSNWFWDDYVDRVASDIQSGHSVIANSIKWDDAGFESKGVFDSAVEETKDAAIAYSGVQQELAQANADVSDQLMLVAESNDKYAELGEGAKSVITNFIDSFDMDDITKDGFWGGKVIDEDAINTAKAQINGFVEKITPEIQNLLDIGSKLKLGLDADGESMDVDSYQKSVKDFIAKVNNIEDEELKVFIKTSFGIDDSDELDGDIEKAIAYTKNLLKDEYDDTVNDMTVEEVLQVYYNISAEPNSLTPEELRVEIIKTASSFDTLSKAATGVISNIQNAQKIVLSQANGQSISLADFSAEGMEDYSSALEYVNGTMQLNADKVREITEAKVAEQISINETNKALAQSQYIQNARQIEEYRRKIKDANYENGETEKTVRASIDALLEENSAIVDTCKLYDLLTSSLKEAIGAYQNWLNAQSASDYGDMEDDAVSAIQNIIDTYDSDSDIFGNFGSKKFDAAIEFIIPDSVDQDDLSAIESYMSDFRSYLSFDENGNVDGLNIDKFLSKSVEAGLMNYSAEDGWTVAGQTAMEDFADGLGLSMGVVQAFFDELQLKGAEFSWGDETTKTLGDLAVEATEAAEALYSIYDGTDEEIDIKIDISDIETTEEQLSTLDDTIAKMNTIKGKANVDASEVEYANSIIRYCITQKQLLTQPDVMRVDTTQVEGDIAEALSLLQQFQEAQNNLEILAAVGADTTEAEAIVNSLAERIQNEQALFINCGLDIDTSSIDSIEQSVAGLTAEAIVSLGVDASAVEGYDPESKVCSVIYDPDTDLLPKSFGPYEATVEYKADLSELPTRLSTLTRDVRFRYVGAGSANGNAHVAGTAKANGDWGTALGGRTLVGELGREIVVDPRTGRWYTVGDNGAEFVNIPAGAIVFNHKQTESLLENGYVSGRASALASGTAMVTGGYKPYKPSGNTGSNSTTNSGTSNSQTTVTVDAKLDPTSLEEQLEDTLQKMAEEIDEIIGNFEHQIFLAEKHGTSADEIIAIYEKMQIAVHEQAEKYRALSLGEESDYIQDLQKQWWDYQDSISEARQSAFDDYLNDSRFTIDMLKADDASASEISRSYSTILKAINDEIAYYLSKGYDTTDDIVQNLIQEAWAVEDEVKDALDDIVAEAQDAVDELQDVYATLSETADEYAEYGFITIDSLQDIINLGVEYMAFLQDENGQLVINKENIQQVIAARTEQLAVESALNYVEQLRLALEAGNTVELQRLLTATTNATNATWGLVYANLALLNLDDSQYVAALNNINALRSLADNAIANIGVSLDGNAQSRTDRLQEQKDALDDILDYTMELIEWEAEQQVEALEEQISDYEKIVELKKEMLKATKEESDYEDELTDKVKAIAKLQERINALSLDDSREAAAERIALEEEMSGLQEELADYQADHMVEAQENALDDMAEAYAAEKEKEIATVEETVSSTEKIYQLAIARISSDWDGLYQDLLAYNYEYGNTIQQDLVNAWNAASLAVQEYGSYVNAVSGIDAALDAADSGGYTSSVVGQTGSYGDGGARNIVSSMRANSIAYWVASDEERAVLNSNQLQLAQQYRDLTGDQIYRENGSWYTENGALMYSLTANEVATAIVSRMKANSAAWSATQSATTRSELEEENEILAARLARYLGANITKSSAGEWFINGEKLYSKYHSGGIVGNMPTLKQDEVMAILQKGEAVLDERREEGLFRLVDFVTDLSERFGKLISNVGFSQTFPMQGTTTADELAALTDNKQTSVQFGDVYIYGANDETVEKHREVNRQFVNDVLKQLNIKR